MQIRQVVGCVGRIASPRFMQCRTLLAALQIRLELDLVFLAF